MYVMLSKFTKVCRNVSKCVRNELKWKEKFPKNTETIQNCLKLPRSNELPEMTKNSEIGALLHILMLLFNLFIF